MNRRVRVLPLIGLFVLPVSLFAWSVPDPTPSLSVSQLFQKSKQQFRYASYGDALSTLDELALLSLEEDNVAYRTTLTPAVAFYRGACLAALGRDGEAKTQFEIYLTFRPDSILDPALYPKKINAVFEQVRAERVRRGTSVTPALQTATGIGATYRAYARVNRDADLDLGEGWGTGPVRYLMTPDESHRFARLSDPVSRSEFVTEFWRTRDPRPETPENEFRDEFERRVAFSDSHFSQDEIRGSLTDRGMVFILLGPPTYIGRKPIRTGEDRSDPSGMSFYSRNDIVAAQIGLDPRASGPVVDRMTGPNNSLPEPAHSFVEVWHYRKEMLPAHLPYQQVDFEFITRPGYGKSVLQRQDTSLTTLEAARHKKLEHS